MAAFNINTILNGVSQAPAGEHMDVALIAHENIQPNPENTRIYIVGDVSGLKADIAANGLRQPLEVIPAGGDKYTLLGGERRWTAIGQLLEEDAANRARFGRVPCIVRQSRGADDDLLALITANSTARELTDGERLAQYEAVKRIFERKKAAGELHGRVRDAMGEALGLGAGTLGRLNAISEHCGDAVKMLLRAGKTTLTKAYDASKLWKCQQEDFCLHGYASPVPSMSAEQREAVWDWIADNADFEGVDWTIDTSYSTQFNNAIDKLNVTAEMSIGRVKISKSYAYLLSETDPDDAVGYAYLLDWRQYSRIREKRLTPEQRAEIEARCAAEAQQNAAPVQQTPGGADAKDVSESDTREDRLEEIADELLTGELPGMWTLMRHDAVLHISSYIIDLPGEQHLIMINPDSKVNDENDRMFLRVNVAGSIVPMDGEDEDYEGWMNTFWDWQEEPVRKALHEAAELLLDGEEAKAGKGAP